MGRTDGCIESVSMAVVDSGMESVGRNSRADGAADLLIPYSSEFFPSYNHSMGKIPEDRIRAVAAEETSPCRSGSRACAVGAACVRDEPALRSVLSAKCPSPFSRNRRASAMVLPTCGRLGGVLFLTKFGGITRPKEAITSLGRWLPSAGKSYGRHAIWMETAVTTADMITRVLNGPRRLLLSDFSSRTLRLTLRLTE